MCNPSGVSTRIFFKFARLRCAYDGPLAIGDSVTMMVRPEAIGLTRQAPANGDNSFVGTVRERYFLGNSCQVKVGCADGSVIQVEEEPWVEVAIGDEVWCSFAPERAWVIPGTSSSGSRPPDNCGSAGGPVIVS